MRATMAAALGTVFEVLAGDPAGHWWSFALRFALQEEVFQVRNQEISRQRCDPPLELKSLPLHTVPEIDPGKGRP